MQLNLGYPLIVGTTRTEDETGENGDLVYCPASILHDGRRKKLDLYQWSENEWRPSRASRYAALTAVNDNGTLRSLADLHIRGSANRVVLEAEFLLNHRAFIFELTAGLFDLAAHSENPKRILSNIFSHWLHPDGRFEAMQEYPTSAEQISRSFTPFEAQINSEFLLNEYPRMKGPIPIFSGIFVMFLEALLKADRKNPHDSHVHFHWGAKSMAGVSPNKGYFFSQGAQRRLKCLYEAAKKVLPNFVDLTIVVLPAPVLLLFPLKNPTLNERRYMKRFQEKSFYEADFGNHEGWIWQEDLLTAPISELNEKAGHFFKSPAET